LSKEADEGTQEKDKDIVNLKINIGETDQGGSYGNLQQALNKTNNASPRELSRIPSKVQSIAMLDIPSNMDDSLVGLTPIH